MYILTYIHSADGDHRSPEASPRPRRRTRDRWTDRSLRGRRSPPEVDEFEGRVMFGEIYAPLKDLMQYYGSLERLRCWGE